MYLKHLSLTHFRNYARLELDLQARIHVLQGANAQGKTNLLEAIYYLATTKSPLASSDRQLIAWDAEQEPIPFSQIDALFIRGQRERRIEVTLVQEPASPSSGDAASERGAFKKRILVDGSARRSIDVVGQVNVVLFLPEDIHLVAGAPAERRRYLDITLCQIDADYCRALTRFNRVVTQRNALLRQVREHHARASELTYWDEQFVELGAAVLARRLWAVARFGHEVLQIQRELTAGLESLTLDYQSCAHQRLARQADATTFLEDPDGGRIDLESSLREVLPLVRREEIGRAVTVVGPHRDDLRFLINGADATLYGSRGQQRTVALALKLAEVRLMQGETGESPILLLDDVLSELDQRRSRLLLDAVCEAEQVLLTTTDLAAFDAAFLSRACLWQVSAGTLAAVGPAQKETPDGD